MALRETNLKRPQADYTRRGAAAVDWAQIDDVLLDMDGTLLDLSFDTAFWLEHLPGRYAAVHNLALDDAVRRIRARMDALRGQLGWYCTEQWSSALGVDVAQLTRELAGGIRYRDTAKAFLEALAASRQHALIVTNAHPETVDIKLHQTGLGRYVDGVVSAHDHGAAKEEPAFWQSLQAAHAFEPRRTLFIDDNLAVLRAAERCGIGYLRAVSHPDSGLDPKDTEEFEAIKWFTEIMPIA